MKRILTLICLLVINFSFSQIKFEAEVSKNNLGVNENLRVDFKMNKDDGLPGDREDCTASLT